VNQLLSRIRSLRLFRGQYATFSGYVAAQTGLIGSSVQSVSYPELSVRNLRVCRARWFVFLFLTRLRAKSEKVHPERINCAEVSC
jgi:hypothetical protein